MRAFCILLLLLSLLLYTYHNVVIGIFISYFSIFSAVRLIYVRHLLLLSAILASAILAAYFLSFAGDDLAPADS